MPNIRSPARSPAPTPPPLKKRTGTCFSPKSYPLHSTLLLTDLGRRHRRRPRFPWIPSLSLHHRYLCLPSLLPDLLRGPVHAGPSYAPHPSQIRKLTVSIEFPQISLRHQRRPSGVLPAASLMRIWLSRAGEAVTYAEFLLLICNAAEPDASPCLPSRAR